jgi:hypothetical protein
LNKVGYEGKVAKKFETELFTKKKRWNHFGGDDYMRDISESTVKSGVL